MTQEQALAILKTGANVFLTGEPGSGKTHTINRYVAYLRARGIEPALTASTGIAATHIGGMTIHSWCGIGIADELTPYDLDRIASNERIYKRLMKAKILVIDEVSMLDARTLAMVDAVCRETRRNPMPFGGLQTVLVGDFFQLPPVARDGRTAEFAFRSSAWAELRPAVCYLSGQYRQDDPEFLSVLSAIRSNAVGEDHLRILESRAAARVGAAKGAVKLFSHNADVDRINEQELLRLPGVERVFAMETKGPEQLVTSLKRGCLSPETLRLKPGAAVMFTRNNPQAGFVNGTLGTVIDAAGENGFPLVRTSTGARIAAEPMEWKIEDQGRVLASTKQVPLRLAWAMTVHKSQGMSLDAALMDLGAAFEFGQGYVALSRVRRLAGLFLLGCNARALEVHPAILEQDGEFRAVSQGAEEFDTQVSAEKRAAAERSFIVLCGGNPDAAKTKLVEEKDLSAAAQRAKHPKAYARWTEREEKELVALFNEGVAMKEIARRLERQRGGIASRLKKLGLVKEEAA
ncbi:MAG: PIF1 family DEAD/DEAH box helicase [Patescibacteria group bacterium]